MLPDILSLLVNKYGQYVLKRLKNQGRSAPTSFLIPPLKWLQDHKNTNLLCCRHHKVACFNSAKFPWHSGWPASGPYKRQLTTYDKRSCWAP